MAVKYCPECGHNVKIPHLVCKGKKMQKQTLYAFWRYDLCPYMLGGVVERFRSNGNVVAKGYNGMSFKPIAILPDQDGALALKLLKELRSEYGDKEKELKKKYAHSARKLVGLED
jgi:hypothetical protein